MGWDVKILGQLSDRLWGLVEELSIASSWLGCGLLKVVSARTEDTNLAYSKISRTLGTDRAGPVEIDNLRGYS